MSSQGHLGGSLNSQSISTGLGGVLDGALRQYGTFPASGLIAMPSNLSYAEAATLPCAALTAWNALYGTGGVSIFAVQFAKLAGATVISTTSSKEKGERLKALGADHVLNYKETTKWGEAAKGLSKGGEGVDFIVEVGGPGTMEQSLNAVAIDGVITIIGFLGGPKAEKEPSILEALNHICTIRGVLVGNRVMGEDMCKAIEANKLKPLVDEGKTFKLEELKEAYQYMWDQKHFGKVVVNIE